MRHNHHIIPRYAGGSDEPENLVSLTPIQHSMWHWAEFQRKGDYKDYCAHKMILGDVHNPDFRRARNIAFQDKIQEGSRKWREANPGIMTRIGKLGYNAQREKFKREGRTIAEQLWIVTTPKGEVIEVRNLAKFCRENNLLKNKMSEVAKGVWQQHRGYKVTKSL